MAKIRLENINELPKRMFTFLLLIVFLLSFGTISFMLLLNLSFSQALFATIGTFAFNLPAESGLARGIGIFLEVFGVILLWWILWSLFDIIYEGNLREYLKISSFLSRLGKMKSHYIIAGGGRVGEEIADHLSAAKKNYIVIEKDEITLNKLKKKNLFVMHGDVTDENVLKQANIETAKIIIIAMPETEKNLLVTMMARELNPTVEIYARADKPAFVSKLKKAGAKVVIVPEHVAAEQFIKSIT